MSFLRHGEIYYPIEGAGACPAPSTHRCNEFPAGYSLASCSPALLASASPTASQYAVQSSCRSTAFQRTANSVLTVCLSPGGKPKVLLRHFLLHVGAKHQPLVVSVIGDGELRCVVNLRFVRKVVNDGLIRACTVGDEVFGRRGCKCNGGKGPPKSDIGLPAGGCQRKAGKQTASKSARFSGPDESVNAKG